jgi:signal transduction histidine kinase
VTQPHESARQPADPGCLHERQCPISHAPCPGECVFAEVMQSAQLGILVLDDPRQRLLFANEEAHALLHAADLEPRYETVRDTFLAAAAKAMPSVGRPAEVVRLGGRLIGYSTYGNDGIRWIYFRDISEKARLESIAEAVELANSFGHVFAAVRHEIGNPVNSVKMALSVLRRNLDRFSREAMIDYLDRSLAELGRVEEMLASLRSFSLYEDVDPQPLALDAFLAEFVGFAARDFAERGVDIELQAGCGALAWADRRALRQILINLLANAADAVAGRAAPRVEIATESAGDLLVLSVRDNGCGIPPEALREVFKPFFTTKPRGTGLGLMIVRKMLARMEATIELESRVGVGTQVFVTLRRAPS